MEKEKITMPGKLIVCLRKRSNTGKTGTIKALAESLIPDSHQVKNTKWLEPYFPKAEYEGMPPEITGWPKKITEWFWRDKEVDICVAVDVQGKEKKKRVGLSSYGDDPDTIRKWLKFLIEEEQCTIIFCACRSKGDTIEAVKKMAKRDGYTIIWTDPYTDHQPPQGMKEQEWRRCLNRKKAGHLEDFI